MMCLVLGSKYISLHPSCDDVAFLEVTCFLVNKITVRFVQWDELEREQMKGEGGGEGEGEEEEEERKREEIRQPKPLVQSQHPSQSHILLTLKLKIWKEAKL